MSAEAKALLEAIGELTAKIESLFETVEPIAARLRAEDDRRKREGAYLQKMCDVQERHNKEIAAMLAKIVYNDIIARGSDNA